MSKRFPTSVAIVAAVAILAAGIYFWQTQRPITVRVAYPEANVPIRVFGLGTVEARVISRLGFEVGAAIVDLPVDQGDSVKKGDVLARLHTAEQEAKLLVAQAVVDSAKAAVGKAEAAVGRANAVLLQRQSMNRRQKELATKNVASRQVAEEAQRDEDVAAADLAVSQSEVTVARTQLEGAEAQLLVEQALLAHHVLKAPFDGVVVSRLQELGAVVKAGDPILTLVAPETVWARAYIDESRAGLVAVGQTAEVRLRSMPQNVLQARVVRIDIESDRTNEERIVYVKCLECPASFHLGEQAEVLITVATLDSAILLPQTDVQGFDGTTGTVWTVDEGKLTKRKVTFGHRTEDSRFELSGGLPPGAQVALGVPANAREGRPVSAERVAGQ